MSNALIYVGIAIAVAAIGGVVAYGTANQANYLPDDAVLQSQADEGTIGSGPLTPSLNKEKWHEDPFGDESAKIRAEYEATHGGK